jgi:hypothetical protein
MKDYQTKALNQLHSAIKGFIQCSAFIPGIVIEELEAMRNDSVAFVYFSGYDENSDPLDVTFLLDFGSDGEFKCTNNIRKDMMEIFEDDANSEPQDLKDRALLVAKELRNLADDIERLYQSQSGSGS